MKFATIDFIIFFGYVLLVTGVALYVSRTKKGIKKSSKEYFLADKSLPWWAVGASLIAANISAEQFIGVSGSGYAIGLAMASYEWTAAVALIVIAKYFLPIFLQKNIYTMPQFLEQRFDNRVRTVLAVFWILLYIFVYLTSVAYLGALFLQTVFGIDLIYGVFLLSAFAALYSIYGRSGPGIPIYPGIYRIHHPGDFCYIYFWIILEAHNAEFRTMGSDHVHSSFPCI